MGDVRRAVTAVAVAASLAACTGGDDGTAYPAPEASETAPSEPEEAADAEAGETAADPLSVELPDTPVGAQLAWVLETLAEDPPGDEAVWTERFDETFLAEVPVPQLRQVFGQFQADWTVTGYEGGPNGLEGVATMTEPEGSTFELLGIVEPEPPHRFTGLLLRPPTEPIDPPDDFDELAARLDEAGDTGVLLAAEVVDGTCGSCASPRSCSASRQLARTVKAAGMQGGRVAGHSARARQRRTQV